MSMSLVLTEEQEKLLREQLEVIQGLLSGALINRSSEKLKDQTTIQRLNNEVENKKDKIHSLLLEVQNLNAEITRLRRLLTSERVDYMAEMRRRGSV